MSLFRGLFPDVAAQLDRIESAVAAVYQKESVIVADLANITAQVSAIEDVEKSAEVLLKTLSDEIASIKTDPVALQALADRIKTSATAWAAAVVANTPAAP